MQITRTSPEKSLVEGLKKSGGRNSYGRKTARHRGGGAKRREARALQRQASVIGLHGLGGHAAAVFPRIEGSPPNG